MRYNMEDEHICCPSYPVCDDAPLGCSVQQGTGNVEWYGHKDKAEWYEDKPKRKKKVKNDKNKSK